MTANVQDAIVIFGDSLTQFGFDTKFKGFAATLASAYARKLDVISRGFSGYNSEWAIPVFEQLLVPRSEQGSKHVQKMRLLIIWLGTNDAVLPSFPPQHVPLKRCSSNLSQMINMVKDPDSKWYSPETKIILITPPPFNSHQWKKQKGCCSFDVTKQYAEAVCKVGKKEGVPVVDAWKALYKAAGENEADLENYLNDGMHLGAEGNRVVYEELIKTIEVNYPGLYYKNLPNVFARWQNIDYENPGPSLKKVDPKKAKPEKMEGSKRSLKPSKTGKESEPKKRATL